MRYLRYFAGRFLAGFKTLANDIEILVPHSSNMFIHESGPER